MTSHNSLSWQRNQEFLTVNDQVVVLEVLPLLEPLGVFVEHHAQVLPDTHGEQLMSTQRTRAAPERQFKPRQPFIDPQAGTFED